MTLEELSIQDIMHLYPYVCARCGRKIRYDEDAVTTDIYLAPAVCTMERAFLSHSKLCIGCTKDLLKFIDTYHPEEEKTEGDHPLDYYAALISDTAKVHIPLPKHILEAMERDGITLISVAGRPCDGLNACGAHHVPHQNKRALVFEHFTFRLDYNAAVNEWEIDVDGTPIEHLRGIEVKLHGNRTKAIVALAKDLGEYKGGA